jgi:hypothetical protein
MYFQQSIVKTAFGEGLCIANLSFQSATVDISQDMQGYAHISHTFTSQNTSR